MTHSKSQVCALIPAYNEAARIGATVDALKSIGVVDRVVVVDDGSTDETASVAKSAGADTVLSQPNAGKGAALSAAYRAAADSEVFLLLDADLGVSAAEAIKLVEPIRAGRADMTIGVLPPDPKFAASGRSGGAGRVVRLASEGIHRLTGQSLRQPLSGQRCVRGVVLEALRPGQDADLFAAGFGVEVALTVGALRLGYRVEEVDTWFRHNVTASDMAGILHRARQYVDVARALRRFRNKMT
ncbi:MAG: glycosyltransferase [Capsulimonadaceae bacterium]